MKKIEYRHSKWFNKLLRFTFGKYLSLRFNVKINNEEIADVKPPYIVIGNHIGAWDPFLMSMGIDEPIYFVISDTHFRHFWLRQVLKLVGGIPKSKQLADSGTIRAIISIIKKNGVVGVYPEGARNWDLKNVPVFYSTAKLIKNLKVPVINTLMEGAGLTRPRWARSSRTGVIYIKYSVLFTPEDISKMSVDEIYQKIVDGIRMNEYEWQEKTWCLLKEGILPNTLTCFLWYAPGANHFAPCTAEEIFSNAETAIIRSGIMNTVILTPSMNRSFFRRKPGAIGRTRIYTNCFHRTSMFRDKYPCFQIRA